MKKIKFDKRIKKQDFEYKLLQKHGYDNISFRTRSTFVNGSKVNLILYYKMGEHIGSWSASSSVVTWMMEI